MDLIPFLWGWLVLFIEAWSSPKILSGNGCHNGQFEGGQLVQAILTKVVFACQRLWRRRRLGLHCALRPAVLLVLVLLHRYANLCLMPWTPRMRLPP